MGPDIAIEEIVETLSLRDLDALRRVLDAVPHPIFIKDDQLRFVVLNQCMCAFMGHPFESMIGRTDHAFVPKEHADIFQRIDRLVLETGEVNENEELIPGSNGEIRTIVTRKKRACLANGARLVVGTITDISELKQREASSRLLFETNPLPMWVFDTETLRFLAVNAAAVEHYGYSREQFLAMTLLDIRPADDVGAFREMVGTRNGSFRTDRSWRHIKADGSAIDVEAYSQSLQYEGHPAWMAAVVDITERKKANEELRRTRQFLDTVIENVPAMLFVKEAKEHRYILMNRAGEELLGIPRDELIGKTDYDFLPQEEADSFFIRDQEVLRADRLHIVEEERIRTRHNGVRDILTKRLSVDGDDGESKYLLGVAEDITERKRAAARIAHLANHDALDRSAESPGFRRTPQFHPRASDRHGGSVRGAVPGPRPLQGRQRRLRPRGRRRAAA